MAGSLQINASTSRDRHSVIAEINERLAAAGAWVTDFHQFSNVSASISFEFGAEKASAIVEALTLPGVALSERSLARLTSDGLNGTIAGSVQITFFHDEGDLRVPVAAVPG